LKVEYPFLKNWFTFLGLQVTFKSVFLFSFVSVIGSNLFSNVPFVIIVNHWVREMSDPPFVWLLLALTSTFAGNLTLFGSVANLIVAQGAKAKVNSRFRVLLFLGIPLACITTGIGILVWWIFWQ
jgi:Na+/H+ antiporter NhaD/arsenite permease-like protein